MEGDGCEVDRGGGEAKGRHLAHKLSGILRLSRLPSAASPRDTEDVSSLM